MLEKSISSAALHRLPIYFAYLQALPEETETISSTAIANALHFGQVQVRKDLALVSTSGKPKTGYPVHTLMGELAHFLGYDKTDAAVIVGSGPLAAALLSENTDRCGLTVTAAFDRVSPQEYATANPPVYPLDRLSPFCRQHHIQTGLLITSPDRAQDLCDRMVEAGIQVIINFTPVFVTVPDTVTVSPHDLSASISIFAKNCLYGTVPKN